jgi:hypothetical protein
MGIEAPIPISSKMGDTNNVFRRIVTAAERPHLSIPETEAGRSRKQYNRLVNRSLMFVSGMLIFGTSRISGTAINVSGYCEFSAISFRNHVFHFKNSNSVFLLWPRCNRKSA